ncbi:MAG: GH92 family glycosyl hydrolase [Edaphobacter sp.]|uniref:GH92 family glycosyl hydrolase n=1 Tax=Edaphobacter sp. TaxID=1934404 RepID=UPI002396FA8A|nr:GH92 family glycosyl hydrolase [Edaphobacter sp.]MDE1175046.1 GH92 family glycosyl hydrolase [Edaphobacter sp.]
MFVATLRRRHPRRNTAMKRREFISLGAAAITSSAFSQKLGSRMVPNATGLVDSVRPLVGTAWRGHTFPGATAPFGLVQLSPDTSGPPEPKWNERGAWDGWEHSSGYHSPDDVLLGFSHTHLSGTGSSDLGDLRIMPIVEGRNWSWEIGVPEPLAEMQAAFLGPDSGWVFPTQVGYRSSFRQETEQAAAGYYKVHLETPNVHAEMTATVHCGVHRYRFPPNESNAKRGLLLDLLHGLGSNLETATLTWETPICFTGSRTTHGWAKDREFFFVLELNVAPTAVTLRQDKAEHAITPGDHMQGSGMQAMLTLPHDVHEVVLRVGISGTGVEGARKNLRAEVQGFNFDSIRNATKAAWADVLNRLSASFHDEKLSQTYATSIYHSYMAPSTWSDVDGTYRDQDHTNRNAGKAAVYTTLSIWDTYRGQVPLMMLSEGKRINDLICTLLRAYSGMQAHSLPMWQLWGNETWSMNGFHAAGIILGAFVRGYRDFDHALALQAMRESAFQGADVKHFQQKQTAFRKNGFIPMEMLDGSVSATLDLAYDFWCAGTFAQLIGKQAEAQELLAYAGNYRNLFDPSVGFMRGKYEDGRWRAPFRPDEEYDEYVESDAWQASFAVPHDIAGLIALHGGDEAFVRKLDALFTSPSFVINARPDITGMVGQQAQGNEPSHWNPYLYVFAGQPWKTQYWVRKVAQLYNPTRAGLPGNDDCGEVSCWFTYAALGFYPVNTANGVYVLGSPLIDRATIVNDVTGARFQIIAESNSPTNLYIQRAELNGHALHRAWLKQEEIAVGGELRFRMGPRPNHQWGTAKDNRPPSGLVL